MKRHKKVILHIFENAKKSTIYKNTFLFILVFEKQDNNPWLVRSDAPTAPQPHLPFSIIIWQRQTQRGAVASRPAVIRRVGSSVFLRLFVWPIPHHTHPGSNPQRGSNLHTPLPTPGAGTYQLSWSVVDKRASILRTTGPWPSTDEWGDWLYCCRTAMRHALVPVTQRDH